MPTMRSIIAISHVAVPAEVVPRSYFKKQGLIYLYASHFLVFLVPLSREKLLNELCRNGGILSLSFTVLKLAVPEWLKGSTDIASSISRQKAKILSILLQLCEAESISYLDEVATSPKSMQLGQTLALEVLDLLKAAFGRKQKPASGSYDKSYPMGSVLISALRLVDVFSDDSNFRSSYITNTIPFLTRILATPHDEFVLSWCSVEVPVMEVDANLDYDPFSAADLALLAASNMLTEAKVNYSCHFRSISMPPIQYAQTRISCVVKTIANLHVFVPNICEEQERDLFLQKFQKYLLSESPKPSLDHPAADEVTIVCTNLGFLSHYAKSLIPGNLLNEEDVQLLSDFACKLQRWYKLQVGQRTLQVEKSDATSQMKEDLQPVQQPQPTRTSVPDPYVDNSPKDVRNIKESMAMPPMKQGNARDETRRNRATINGVLLQNSVGQNLIHLGVARTTSTGYPGAGVVSSMELPRCRTADHFKTPEPTKESGLRDEDERQPRRGKKRTIMTDGQVNKIENALVDEPEMHMNAISLQTWAEKLSGQGAEITSSQLKNWLNNRKAKLARVAKERGVPYEGESADKPPTPGTSQLGDSLESDSEESCLPPSRVLNALGISNSKGSSRLFTPDSREPTAQGDMNETMIMSRPFTRSLSFEPGHPVLLIDNEGNEIGRGEIFQVDRHICIVDVTELKVDKWRDIPYPSEAWGRTFQEAESRHGGVMRVAWDVVRLAPVAP